MDRSRRGSPRPVACIWHDNQLIGWVDYDVEHDWLEPGHVNVGYYLFAAARGNGFASRAVELLLAHLSRDTDYVVATLVIDPENTRSLALARRLEFVQTGEIEGKGLYFTREIRRLAAAPSRGRDRHGGRGTGNAL